MKLCYIGRLYNVI